MPTRTPTAEITNVVQPINPAARKMLTCSVESVMPAASASMLVAIAISSIGLKEYDASTFSSSSESASRIMFAPSSASRMNAIQWSRREMYFSKVEPSR